MLESTEIAPVDAREKSPEVQAVIRSRGLTWLLVVASLLCATSYIGQIASKYVESSAVDRAAKWVNVNAEGNLPTWFSTMLLGAASLSCLLVAATRGCVGGTVPKQWVALSGVMLLMCVDEAAQVHEKFNTIMHALKLTGVSYFAWMIPWSIIVLVVGATFLRFLVSLPPHHRWPIIASGVVFIGGALGVEVIEALIFFDETGIDLKYEFVATVQEWLEMAGILLFLRAIHRVLAEISPVRLQFASS